MIELINFQARSDLYRLLCPSFRYDKGQSLLGLLLRTSFRFDQFNLKAFIFLSQRFISTIKYIIQLPCFFSLLAMMRGNIFLQVFPKEYKTVLSHYLNEQSFWLQGGDKKRKHSSIIQLTQCLLKSCVLLYQQPKRSKASQKFPVIRTDGQRK